MENKRSARLVWDTAINEECGQTVRSIHEIQRVLINPVFDNQAYFEQIEEPLNADNINNRYYYGDNYDLLVNLAQPVNTPKIDLIYIDPPYMSELDYHSTISIGNHSHIQHINREAFQDRWPLGLDSYLDMMYGRLKLMRQVLADTGSIFVHVDWHASHYVRVLLDEIFGRENFINEIVWCFSGGSSSRKYFHRKHDLIFWYARSSEYVYNPQYRPYTQGTLERGLTNVKGNRYKLHQEGALMQDWWVDINKILSPTAYENLKFPTQKPKDLIRRLVAAASQPGDTVADFFAGSGSLAEVCNETGRNWILCDNNKLALQTCYYRLIRSGAPPFVILGDNSQASENKGAELELRTPIIQVVNEKKILINIGIKYFKPASLDKQPIQHDFADYIEFWEIDPDYNGEYFNSQYQVIRKKQRFKETIALDIVFPAAAGNERKIAIQIWDVWANQTMEVVKI